MLQGLMRWRLPLEGLHDDLRQDGAKNLHEETILSDYTNLGK